MPQDDPNVKEECELSFEVAIEQLENLVADMEQGGLTLQQMIDKADAAAKLSVFCQKQLNELNEKVKILTKDSASGQTWNDFDAQQ